MMSFSLASAAPPSTITIASLEHGDDQVDVGLLAAARTSGKRRTRRRCATTRMPTIGPSHGMSEMCSAALAPVSASTSVGLILSAERTVAMICVSLLVALGEERTERAVHEATGEDFVVALARLRA